MAKIVNVQSIIQVIIDERGTLMQKPKVAIITIGDTRSEFYQKREHIVREEIEKVKQALNKDFELYVSEPILTMRDALYYADKIKQELINSVVLHIPIWGTPNLALRIADSTPFPVLLLGNKRIDSSSLVCLLAVAGMLGQMGKNAIRVIGDVEEEIVIQKITNYVKACHTIEQLSRSNFCLLGGRSIGIGTTVADASQLQQLFGIEFDHCDQYEIVRRAESIETERIEKYFDWIEKNIGKLDYEGSFTCDSLIRQIKSYLAIKDLVKENEYDFMGLKCQQELSDNYAIQCLAVALLNNDYDAEGPKKVIPCSCEADIDGALTMKILSLCNENKPSNLMDIRYFNPEKKEFIFTNCGAMAFYFAEPGNPKAALKKVYMMQNVFGKAGGGTTQFVAAEGDVTVARLFRNKGRYIMAMFEGEIIEKPREEMYKTTYCYPHAYISADIDYDCFIQTIGANHMHAVYGKYAETLKMICEMKNIEYICFNKDRKSNNEC